MVGPDTRALPRAERAVGWFVAALRVATLVQMLPSLVTAVDVSAYPALCALTWAVAGVAVVATATASLVRRRPPGLRWATADTLVAAALLLLGLLTVPVEYRTGSWIGFQSAYSLSVACTLVGVRDRRQWMALLGVLVVARTVYVLPIVTSPADVPTVLGELLTLLAWHRSPGWAPARCTASPRTPTRRATTRRRSPGRPRSAAPARPSTTARP